MPFKAFRLFRMVLKLVYFIGFFRNHPDLNTYFACKDFYGMKIFHI